MGDLRMCFDASAYNRALADAQSLGFDVKDQQTWLEGKYYCSNGDSEEDMVLIDKRQPVTGHVNGQPAWVDGSGRMFKVIEYNNFPDGVSAVVWDIRTDGNLMFQSLRDFYKCEVKNNKKCVDRVTTEYSSKKIEKDRTDIEGIVEKGDAFWTKAQELIDLAEYCDKGPGGIDPDDLREIRDDYPVTKKKGQQTYAEANEYLKKAEEMFEKMVMNFSGFESIREKGNRIYCDIIRETTSYTSCYKGGSRNGTEWVACPDLNFSSESKKFHSSDCEERNVNVHVPDYAR